GMTAGARAGACPGFMLTVPRGRWTARGAEPVRVVAARRPSSRAPIHSAVAAGVNPSRLIRAPDSGYDEAISTSLMTKVKNVLILNQLRKYRKARGLKQREAARILGFADASSLSRWVQGVCLPSVMNLFRLAALYRTLVDALYIDTLRTLREEVRRREVAA